MQDLESVLRIILLIVLILGLIFFFIYLALTLKNLSGILKDVKNITDRVESVTRNPEKFKASIEEWTIGTVDKVVDRQLDRVKGFVSNNILGVALKLLGRNS